MSRQTKAAKQEYYQRNRERILAAARARRRNHTPRQRLQEIYGALVQRARKKGLEVDVDVDWLVARYEKQKGLCALTDMRMVIGPKDTASMTVDRIDPAEGYVVGNVQLVAKGANIIKNTLPRAELLKFCAAVLESTPNGGVP